MSDHIQIGDVAPRIQYVANGLQTAFPYSFPIFAAADIEVWLDAVKQNSGYAVTGAGSSLGGTVTFDSAPANGKRVTLRRRLAIQRTTDFQEGGAFRAKTINDELDYQTAALQQVSDDQSRAVQRAATSGSTADLTLPEPQAGRALKWNQAGDGLANTGFDPDTLGTGVAEAAASAAAALASAEAAEESAGSAAAAAAAAQAAAGGVRVSANDTTPSNLEAKLLAAGGLLALSTQNDGGNETRTIDLPVASQAEAEAGASSTKAMTPQRTAQAIAALASGKDSVARDQIALTNLRLLLATSVASGALVQGKQWELASDEWGSSSSNETYVAGSPNYYANDGGGYTADVCSGGTAISAGSDAASPSLAFDGSIASVSGSDWFTNESGSSYGVAAIGYDFGSGVTKDIRKIGIVQNNSNRWVSSVIVQYSDDGSSWTNHYTATGITNGGTNNPHYIVIPTSGGAHRYWRMLQNSNTNAGGSYGWDVCEIEMYEATAPANMTLIPPAAVSVNAAPGAILAYFLWKDDSGTAALGTDLTVELSRDSGTTYTAATLTNLGSYDGTYSVIKARADVAAQPSGTSLLCRIKTLNNKAQRVAAPALYAE